MGGTPSKTKIGETLFFLRNKTLSIMHLIFSLSYAKIESAFTSHIEASIANIFPDNCYMDTFCAVVI